jgi:uncharacterized phage-like protein YoqJ
MKYVTQTIEAHGIPVEETRYEPQYPELYNNKIACFTGHRKVSESVELPLNKAIDTALEMGINHFFVGMALGSDQLAARMLIARNLPWTAVIPCANQSALWSLSQKQFSDRLLRYAESKVILSANYTAGCMQVRNQYMLDHSDVCIAIYDGRITGGTAGTVRMARKRNLSIIQVNPKTLQITKTKPILQMSMF